MEADLTECWFCSRPVLTGERANRAPRARIAVHADCLRHDALSEGARPPEDGLATTGRRPGA